MTLEELKRKIHLEWRETTCLEDILIEKVWFTLNPKPEKVHMSGAGPHLYDPKKLADRLAICIPPDTEIRASDKLR